MTGLLEVLRLYAEAALAPSQRPAALRRLKEMAADPHVDPDLRAAARRYHDDLDARDIAELNAQIAAVGGIEELRRQLDAADATDKVLGDLDRILTEHRRKPPP